MFLCVYISTALAFESVLLSQALQGPTLQPVDLKGIQVLIDKLESWARNIQLLGELHQLNVYESVQAIARRLKRRLRDDYSGRKHECNTQPDANLKGRE